MDEQELKKRKCSKYWINNKGYLGIRIDIFDRAGTLTMLDDIKDFLKFRYYPALTARNKPQEDFVDVSNKKTN